MLNLYVFSRINWFDHNLTSKIILSDKSEIDVVKEQLDYIKSDNIEDAKIEAFNADEMFNIIKVISVADAAKELIIKLENLAVSGGSVVLVR